MGSTPRAAPRYFFPFAPSLPLLSRLLFESYIHAPGFGVGEAAGVAAATGFAATAGAGVGSGVETTLSHAASARVSVRRSGSFMVSGRGI